MDNGQQRYLRDIEKELPKEKPSLLEIGQMPFPMSMVAMRRFYNKDWHKPEHDGQSPAKWSVTINYTRRESDCFTADIEAACEEDAKKLAEEQFDKQSHWLTDVEIDEIEAEFVETRQ